MTGKMPCHISDGPQTPEDWDDWFTACHEEDPDEAYDRLRQERIDDKIAPMGNLTGWSSDYYKLPAGATELQDLIEYKNMNFAVANVFKAAYRLGNKRGTDELYDLDKILWFAHREKARILKQREDAE